MFIKPTRSGGHTYLQLVVGAGTNVLVFSRFEIA